MKYEYIPTAERSKMKKIAATLLFGGLIIMLVGAINAIPFRVGFQIGGIVLLTLSIFVMGKYILKAYRYRIDDYGDGYEFFVDEITRSTCYSVCRLELSKLKSVKKWEDCGKDIRNKKRYSYCPDIFGDGTYLLEFLESDYDNTSDTIRIRITPDEKLLSIFHEYETKNAEKRANKE